MIELLAARFRAACLALLVLPCFALVAEAQREVAATVVWQRGDRVYLASRDSTSFRVGDRVTFLDRGKPIASGAIERVWEGEMAAARLTAGSLARVKRLDRLRVWSDPAPVPRLSSLGIGCPALGRSSALFADLRSDSGFARRGYRIDMISPDSIRLVRAPEAEPTGWPDTLRIQLFDQAADQEIAFERGEIDVAVFWPGELTARGREESPRRRVWFGAWPDGVLAARVDPASGATGERAAAAALAALDRGFLRGDLEPLGAARDSLETSGADFRVTVDPAMPGARAIERFFSTRARDASSDRALVRLLYVEAGIEATDSLLAEVGVVGLSRIQCAVVWRPERDRTMQSIGAEALIDLTLRSSPSVPR